MNFRFVFHTHHVCSHAKSAPADTKSKHHSFSAWREHTRRADDTHRDDRRRSPSVAASASDEPPVNASGEPASATDHHAASPLKTPPLAAEIANASDMASATCAATAGEGSAIDELELATYARSTRISYERCRANSFLPLLQLVHHLLGEICRHGVHLSTHQWFPT